MVIEILESVHWKCEEEMEEIREEHEVFLDFLKVGIMSVYANVMVIDTFVCAFLSFVTF